MVNPFQFAKEYGVPYARVYSLLKQGKLPVIKEESDLLGNADRIYIDEGSLTSEHHELLDTCTPNYPDYIMEMVRENLELDEDDTSRDDAINIMSKGEVFERVLEWEGICGYRHFLTRWIKDIYGVNLEDYND